MTMAVPNVGGRAQPVSIIIPSFNGAHRLPHLLQSIRDQDYDQGLIEIVVVDDDSTDDTVRIAESFGAVVVRNGHRNIERGKAIGFHASSFEYVMFIDDDNRLPHASWLSRAMGALAANPEAVGVQAAWFSVKTDDPAMNRYCSIFGVGDPLAMYLRRKDHLARFDRRWTLPGQVVEETASYWKVRFAPSTFLTIGSQGFIGRRALIRTTQCSTYLFHIDSNYDLMLHGHDTFIMLKDEVEHDYCTSLGSLIGKKRRDIRLFLAQRESRSFRWQTPPLRFGLAVLTMLTVVEPVSVAVRAFASTKDPACFLHPVTCFVLPFVYASEVVGNAVSRKMRRPRAATR